MGLTRTSAHLRTKRGLGRAGVGTPETESPEEVDKVTMITFEKHSSVGHEFEKR